MKFVLAIIIFFGGQFLFAKAADSLDTNYRLYDFNRSSTVDTSIQFILVETEAPRIKWSPQPFGYGDYGTPYNSVQHFNPKLAGIISISFLAFILYIILRVRRSIRKDKQDEFRK